MDRHRQIEDLYRVTHGHLQRIVSANVNTSASNIDDACAFAWTQLTQRPHLELTVFPRITGWLATTAIREALRLDHADRRFQPLPDEFGNGRSVSPPPLSAALETRESLDELLAPATERQRRVLILVALGHSYTEIAAVEGGSFRTVDRQLHRGRERIRQARATACPPRTQARSG
jgi:DNA-directed RNA polymerase specialized sigma24 family protein